MKKKILNLHACIGGNRKGWDDSKVEVTAVELDESLAKIYQENFPNDKVIVGDAKEYLAKHYMEFDFIWASPSCTTHSRIRAMGSKAGSFDAVLPNMELYQYVVFLQHFFKGKWVVENVIPYYEPLIKPAGKLGRHLIWCNFNFDEIMIEDCKTPIKHVTSKGSRYGFDLSGKKTTTRKDQVLRNLVNPEISKYLLDCACNDVDNTLNNFIQ
jgi:DNA (cytosine-5)-methyltransferase 1